VGRAGLIMRTWVSAAALAALWAWAGAAQALPEDEAVVTAQGQGGVDGPEDLARLSLEELAQVEITSVSLRGEPLAGAAAAVFVITPEDIRRSGALSLPEVLRLAPNLNVQRINASDYAITARGFNGYEQSNKLLVLIDGRSVYSTLHSGVFWEHLGVVLEDVERIEVISGPGGALYGANAVNSVINIITKSALDTRGPALSATYGTDDKVLSLRHGGSLGDHGAWRVWATGFERENTRLVTGASARDESDGGRLGFRADWAGGRDNWTVQGDVYEHQVASGEPMSTADVSGGFLQLGWSRDLQNGGRLEGHIYRALDWREFPLSNERRAQTDVRLQHTVGFGAHTIVWGGNYRWNKSRLTSAIGVGLNPVERDITLGALFAQDQWAITPNLTLTLGAKLEDDSFTGTAFLPSARVAWRPGGNDLIWAAVSRAVRTPSRIERDLSFPGFLEPANFQSEELTAYEVGYRARPNDRLNFSVSLFHNEYDKLRTVSLQPGGLPPLNFTNRGGGSAWGGEAWGSLEVNPRWRLKAGASYLDKDLSSPPPPADITGLVSQGFDPDNQLFLASEAQLTDRVEFDLRLRRQGDLQPAGLDAYTEADARLSYRLRPEVELALVGSNLLNDYHVETGEPVRRRQIARSVSLQLRAGF